MEGTAIEILEKEFQDGNNLTQEHLLDENSGECVQSANIPEKSVQELSQEEETLQAHLDKLREENFTLKASIKAWQTTLQSKLQEFKQVDLKLDETYKEIWSEREKFCLKADQFNESYGTLSDWWETQMKFVSDLENLEKKNQQDQQHKEEIQRLEKEIEQLKKEITELQKKNHVTEAQVHANAEGEPVSLRAGNSSEDISPVLKESKKMKYSEPEEEIGIYEQQTEPPNNVLYSMLDVEKVRRVNRLRKTQFAEKMKNFFIN